MRRKKAPIIQCEVIKKITYFLNLHTYYLDSITDSIRLDSKPDRFDLIRFVIFGLVPITKLQHKTFFESDSKPWGGEEGWGLGKTGFSPSTFPSYSVHAQVATTYCLCDVHTFTPRSHRRYCESAIKSRHSTASLECTIRSDYYFEALEYRGSSATCNVNS